MLDKAVLLIVSMLTFAGCTHTQLRWNTVKQSETLTDIYQQQVLDNLALFVSNPHAVPHFMLANGGTTDVTDGGTFSGGRLDEFRANGAFGASRSMKEAWGLDPVRDPDKLRRMRCAYQRAVGVCSDTCNDCCSIEKRFHGSGDQQIAVIAKKQDGSIEAKTGVTDPLTGLPFVATDENGMIILGSDGAPTTLNNPRSDKPYALTERKDVFIVSIPAYDCNGPCTIKCGWFETGCLHDIPLDCKHYSGHYCDTVVWVNSEYRHELSKLVLLIMDYAVNSPSPRLTKQVEFYVGKDGTSIAKKSDAYGKVTATIPVGERNSAINFVSAVNDRLESRETTQKSTDLEMQEFQLRGELSGLYQERAVLKVKTLARVQALDGNSEIMGLDDKHVSEMLNKGGLPPATQAMLQEYSDFNDSIKSTESQLESVQRELESIEIVADEIPEPSASGKRNDESFGAPGFLRQQLYLDALGGSGR